MSKIALADMDGCLADWDTAARAYLKKLEAPCEDGLYDYENMWQMQDKHPHFEERVQLIMGRTGFWAGLNPIQRGINLYRYIKLKFDETHILTKAPRQASNAWSEKVDWIRKHVGEEHIKITTSKHLVYGDLFLEDYPKNIEPWLERHPKGVVVMPVQSWNKDFHHPRVYRWHEADTSRIFHFISRVAEGKIEV